LVLQLNQYLENLTKGFNMLDSKIVIVTGGSGLLGKAIINDLITNQANVINFDIKNITNAEFFRCDVTDDTSIQNCVVSVMNKYGRIDALINNAYPRTEDWGKNSFEDINPASWRKNIDFQLNSYVMCIKAIIPVMLKQNFGSIINIASIYGIVGNDFTIYESTNMNPPAEYSAIKGGIINLSRYLASKYGKNNIRVNCVSPGGIFDNQNENFVRVYEDRVPLKRMAKPEDIAPAVTFLSSDGAQYITGHNLVVDGGWTVI